MPFPKNNLPSASLPWGREVEDQIEILKDTVAKNNVNSSADTATNQTNIKNINAILADQLELKTYFTEINPNIVRSVSYTGSYLQTTFDTSDLKQYITISKNRTAVIGYSSQYLVQNAFTTNIDNYYWWIRVDILVDGQKVSSSYVQKSRNFSTGTNPYSYESDSGNLVCNKRVILSAGSHEISVVIKSETQSGSNFSPANTITISGDDLSTSIIQ